MDQSIFQSRDIYIKYLNIYYNDQVNWNEQIDNLFKKLKTSGNKEKLPNQLAATILMPFKDKSLMDSGLPPEKLLFGCVKFDRFETVEWFKEFKKIVEDDEEILATRKQAADIGIIYPIEYNPRTRQAFSWLVDEALRSPTTDGYDDSVIKEKMENIVLIYGGAVICNIFNKPEYKNKIKNIHNWRTAYFFEKLIYEVYKPEEILKIKAHDIEQIRRSNPDLIKRKS